MGDHSPEPVDETCLVINFIVRTSNLFCLVMYLKVKWFTIAYNITCHLIIIILLHVLSLLFYIINDCNRNQF